MFFRVQRFRVFVGELWPAVGRISLGEFPLENFPWRISLGEFPLKFPMENLPWRIYHGELPAPPPEKTTKQRKRRTQKKQKKTKKKQGEKKKKSWSFLCPAPASPFRRREHTPSQSFNPAIVRVRGRKSVAICIMQMDTSEVHDHQEGCGPNQKREKGKTIAASVHIKNPDKVGAEHWTPERGKKYRELPGTDKFDQVLVLTRSRKCSISEIASTAISENQSSSGEIPH